MRIACLVIAGSVWAASHASGQELVPDTVQLYLAPFHGVGSYSGELRDSLRRDTIRMALYVDLLESRKTTSRAWSPAVALWWLAENGDAKYVPQFLSFAREDVADGEFKAAVYGLARHAWHVPAARDRLLELARSTSENHRAMLAMILMYVNDEASRTVLLHVTAAGLPTALRDAIPGVLASPPRPQGNGRFPCSDDEMLGTAPDGVFRCVSRPPR